MTFIIVLIHYLTPYHSYLLLRIFADRTVAHQHDIVGILSQIHGVVDEGDVLNGQQRGVVVQQLFLPADTAVARHHQEIVVRQGVFLVSTLANQHLDAFGQFLLLLSSGLIVGAHLLPIEFGAFLLVNIHRDGVYRFAFAITGEDMERTGLGEVNTVGRRKVTQRIAVDILDGHRTVIDTRNGAYDMLHICTHRQ